MSAVPNRYSFIGKIMYPAKKIFHLLFEDSHKFNEHFERRKNKPSDQNYNINERIYEEITTKVYFNFLCQFIVHMEEYSNSFFAKIKIFVLYCIKVADAQLIDRIFDVLDTAYCRDSHALYANLFEDYRELNCVEENLQGDEIALLFTFYLYKKAIKSYNVTIEALGVDHGPDLHVHFLNFLKTDIASPIHTRAIYDTLKLSMALLPHCNKLPKILKEYLMNGTYNEIWGSIILRLAI